MKISDYGDFQTTVPSVEQINALVHQHAFTYCNLYLSNIGDTISGTTGMPRIKLYRRENFGDDDEYSHATEKREDHPVRAPLESWSYARMTKGTGQAWATTLGSMMPISQVLMSYMQTKGADEESNTIMSEGEAEFFSSPDHGAAMDLGYLGTRLDLSVDHRKVETASQQLHQQLRQDRINRFIIRQKEERERIGIEIGNIESTLIQIDSLLQELGELNAEGVAQRKDYDQSKLALRMEETGVLKAKLPLHEKLLESSAEAIAIASSPEIKTKENIGEHLVLVPSSPVAGTHVACTKILQSLQFMNVIYVKPAPTDWSAVVTKMGGAESTSNSGEGSDDDEAWQ